MILFPFFCELWLDSVDTKKWPNPFNRYDVDIELGVNHFGYQQEVGERKSIDCINYGHDANI